MEIPAAKAPVMHRMPVQLRFRDIDMFGHVNNNVYFEVMDTAKAQFYADVHGGNLNPKVIGLVVVHVECDFHQPTLLGEPIEVTTGMFRVSERSVSLEQRVINSQTGAVKCTSITILAGFDPKTMQGAPVPPIYGEYFSQFAPN